MNERFIKKAKVDFASVHYMTPLPGTAVYEQFRFRIEAAKIPWDRFTCGDPDTLNVNDAMSPEEQRYGSQGPEGRNGARLAATATPVVSTGASATTAATSTG